MREQNIQQRIRLEAHKHGLILFRNNTGKLEDKRGRWVNFGLCKGSSDLIGWQKSTGKFVAIEVKIPGKDATPEQKHFIDKVREFGGIAGVARCPEDIVEIILDCS